MSKTKLFQFTLVLKQTHAHTNDLEENLYEGGCDDALIHFRNGAIYLEFDREATTLEEAVISAIKEVHASSMEVASVTPSNFVTESEIAKRLHLSRQTVSLWIKAKRRKAFPPPVMRLGDKSPLWNWSEVTQWLYQNKIIQDKELVENAVFFSNINAALEERDQKTKKMREALVAKISS